MAELFPWQVDLWQQIIGRHKQHRLPHAWLLTGNRGLGKTQLAHYLSAWLFCSKRQVHPCQECRSCWLWQTGQHPDFYWLKNTDKTAYHTQNIRLLHSQLLQSAQQSAVKVAVIEAADQLTLTAANALLKIIEEPPSDVYFILVTHRPILLPITLRSRCQHIYSAVPPVEQSLPWLQEHTTQPQAILKKTLQLVHGSPLLALALLQQPELLAEQQKNANDFLAVVSGQQFAMRVAAEWAQIDESRLVALVQYCLQRIIRSVLGVTSQEKTQVFANVPITHWFMLYDEILLGYRRLLQTPGLSRQLFWEHFLLKAQELALYQS